jgi:hypothetical protein
MQRWAIKFLIPAFSPITFHLSRITVSRLRPPWLAAAHGAPKHFAKAGASSFVRHSSFVIRHFFF